MNPGSALRKLGREYQRNSVSSWIYVLASLCQTEVGVGPMGKQLSCFLQKNNCCLLKLLPPNPLQPSGMMPLSLLLALLQIMVDLLGFPRSHYGTQMFLLVATEVLMQGVYRAQLLEQLTVSTSTEGHHQLVLLPLQDGGEEKSVLFCSVSCLNTPDLSRTSLVHPRHHFVLGHSAGKKCGRKGSGNLHETQICPLQLPSTWY